MGLGVVCDEEDLCVCVCVREKETILLLLLLGWNCQSTGGHPIRETGQRSTLTGLAGTRQLVPTSVSLCPALRMWVTCSSCSCLCQLHKYLDHDLEGLEPHTNKVGWQVLTTPAGCPGPGVYTNF